MAGVAGNVETVALGKQTAKGTPQTTPQFKLKLTGGDISPTRETQQLAETDSSRQGGLTVVTGSWAEGSLEHYVRPTDYATRAYALLGANADSGSSPNYTHLATPAGSGPYFTIYKAIGATVLVDRYEDCRMTAQTVRGAAGGILTSSDTWAGLGYTLGQADPVLTAVSEAPFTYPELTCTIGGSAPHTVESFELTIANNGSNLRGDGSLAPYEYIWGKLAVTGTLTMLFESDAEYRRHFTGSTSGTVATTVVSQQTLSIKALKNANLSIEWIMAGIAWTAYPITGNPGGDPIRVAAAFASQPQTAISDYISISTKNQAATA